MNVRELKEIIKDLPDTLELFMDERLTNEFRYGLVNSAKVREIVFSEGDYSEEPLAKDKVLILSED